MPNSDDSDANRHSSARLGRLSGPFAGHSENGPCNAVSVGLWMLRGCAIAISDIVLGCAVVRA